MSSSSPATVRGSTWPLVHTAAAIRTITMGAPQSLVLFVSPLNTATGLGIVAISFAMAVGQFTWGASQPIFGAIADRYGAMWVIVAGGIMLAIGMALTPFASSQWMLLVTIGIISAAGAGAGSFSILIGATARHLPPEKRAFAAGFINAGGSFGQFLFAPLNQLLISSFGWVTAMMAMAATALATLPLARIFRRKPVAASASATPAGSAPAGIGLRQQLRIAARDKSY
jgi:MFS family permease